MTSSKQDVKILIKYEKELQKWYEASFQIIDADLKPSPDDAPITSPEEEMVARIADDNGFDGSLFRYLMKDDNPLSIESINRLRKKLKTIPRIIAKIEKEADNKQNDTEPNDLVDLAKAIKLVHISRTQLKRDIRDKKISTYLKNPKRKHLGSTTEIKKLYLVK